MSAFAAITGELTRTRLGVLRLCLITLGALVVLLLANKSHNPKIPTMLPSPTHANIDAILQMKEGSTPSFLDRQTQESSHPIRVASTIRIFSPSVLKIAFLLFLLQD